MPETSDGRCALIFNVHLSFVPRDGKAFLPPNFSNSTPELPPYAPKWQPYAKPLLITPSKFKIAHRLQWRPEITVQSATHPIWKSPRERIIGSVTTSFVSTPAGVCLSIV